MALDGKDAVVEVGPDASNLVQISGSDTGFTSIEVSRTKSESRNPGVGVGVYSNTGHTEGSVSFSVYDNPVSRAALGLAHGTQLLVRYSREGKGKDKPYEDHVINASVTRTAEAGQFLTYSVAGDDRVAPTPGTH